MKTILYSAIYFLALGVHAQQNVITASERIEGGSCGFPVDFGSSTEPIAAVGRNDFGGEFKGSACGKCVSIKGPDGTVTAKIVSRCEKRCDSLPGTMALSKNAAKIIFTKEPPSSGLIQAEWKIIDCSDAKSPAGGNPTTSPDPKVASPTGTVSNENNSTNTGANGISSPNAGGNDSSPSVTSADIIPTQSPNVNGISPGTPPSGGNNGTSPLMDEQAKSPSANTGGQQGEVKKGNYCRDVRKGEPCSSAGNLVMIDEAKILAECERLHRKCNESSPNVNVGDCDNKLKDCKDKVQGGDRSPDLASETFGLK